MPRTRQKAIHNVLLIYAIMSALPQPPQPADTGSQLGSGLGHAPVQIPLQQIVDPPLLFGTSASDADGDDLPPLTAGDGTEEANNAELDLDEPVEIGGDVDLGALDVSDDGSDDETVECAIDGKGDDGKSGELLLKAGAPKVEKKGKVCN